MAQVLWVFPPIHASVSLDSSSTVSCNDLLVERSGKHGYLCDLIVVGCEACEESFHLACFDVKDSDVVLSCHAELIKMRIIVNTDCFSPMANHSISVYFQRLFKLKPVKASRRNQHEILGINTEDNLYLISRIEMNNLNASPIPHIPSPNLRDFINAEKKRRVFQHYNLRDSRVMASELPCLEAIIMVKCVAIYVLFELKCEHDSEVRSVLYFLNGNRFKINDLVGNSPQNIPEDDLFVIGADCHLLVLGHFNKVSDSGHVLLRERLILFHQNVPWMKPEFMIDADPSLAEFNIVDLFMGDQNLDVFLEGEVIPWVPEDDGVVSKHCSKSVFSLGEREMEDFDLLFVLCRI